MVEEQAWMTRVASTWQHVSLNETPRFRFQSTLNAAAVLYLDTVQQEFPVNAIPHQDDSTAYRCVYPLPQKNIEQEGWTLALTRHIVAA